MHKLLNSIGYCITNIFISSNESYRSSSVKIHLVTFFMKHSKWHAHSRTLLYELWKRISYVFKGIRTASLQRSHRSARQKATFVERPTTKSTLLRPITKSRLEIIQFHRKWINSMKITTKFRNRSRSDSHFCQISALHELK